METPHSNYTILIVEDDFLNRRLIKNVLLEAGYSVCEASRAAEAITILDTGSPDLAILDINLENTLQDGVSVGAYIRQKNAIPFIYLTAYETTEIIKKALTTEPASYITKPFSNTDLLVSVEIAIRNAAKIPAAVESSIITVRDGDFFLELPTDQIDYVETEGNYLKIYSDAMSYSTRSSIKNILELLPPNQFMQTHRAYVVNISKVEKFSIRSLVVNKTAIPVSKLYADKVKSVFSNGN